MDGHAAAAKQALGYSRWWQLAAAAGMMALVSPYQYVWSSIEGPLAAELSVSLSAIGFVFTTYVVVMTLVQFPAGWWRDRAGPQMVTLVAGICAGGGYLGLAVATTLWQVALAYAVGAAGVGMVYTVAVNTAVKWFPTRRGLTTGVGTMAFAAGSALFIPVVRWLIADDALTTGFWAMGLLIGGGILLGTVVLQDPPQGWPHDFAATSDEASNATDSDDASDETSDPTDSDDTSNEANNPTDSDDTTTQSQREYSSREMVRTWQFWVLYVMFAAVSATGLMITARVILYAESAGLTARVATLAAVAVPLSSAGGRLLVGDLSDRVDRASTAAVALLACGGGTVGVVATAGLTTAAGFVIAVAVAVFCWSSQFSVFPSLVGDYYGASHSSTNYAVVYSGKLWGGVFGGGVVGWLVGSVGWDAAFLVGAALAVGAGLLGFSLRPPE